MMVSMLTRTKQLINIIIIFFIGAWFIFKDTSALAYSQKDLLYSTLQMIEQHFEFAKIS
jgi:hypothetical protein